MKLKVILFVFFFHFSQNVLNIYCLQSTVLSADSKMNEIFLISLNLVKGHNTTDDMIRKI